jgi:error-prone DNA polymerase
MGFYSPQSLVQDARRHGVVVLRPDITRSGAQAGLEPPPVGSTTGGMDSCLVAHHTPTPYDEHAPDPTQTHRRDGNRAVRLGLDSVRGIGADLAKRIVEAREERAFSDMLDLSRRAGLDSGHLEALATAGAFAAWGLGRREALWNAGFTERADQLEGAAAVVAAPSLPGLDAVGHTLADLWATRISPDGHPFEHLRPMLTRAGIKSVEDLMAAEAGRRAHVAGLVTHRQRPGTAGGVTFLNLEDETGMLNVICTRGVWLRYRRVARNAHGMVIRGLVERQDGVTNLVADRITSLDRVNPDAERALQGRHQARNFH